MRETLVRDPPAGNRPENGKSDGPSALRTKYHRHLCLLLLFSIYFTMRVKTATVTTITMHRGQLNYVRVQACICMYMYVCQCVPIEAHQAIQLLSSVCGWFQP